MSAKGLQRLVFERPVYCKSAAAGETLHGLAAIVMRFAVVHDLPWSRVAPQSVKKHAVSKGNANKAQMVAAAKEKWPEQEIRDDNQADALWLLDYWFAKEAEIAAE